MRSLAAVAAMGLMMAGDDFLTGPMPVRGERRQPGPAQPEKSNRKAALAEQAARRRSRMTTPPLASSSPGTDGEAGSAQK